LQPRFETFTEKTLVGKKLTMSFANNKTRELWQSFMPRRHEIQNTIGSELYSVEIYKPQFFDSFDPGAEFEKWAAVAVPDFEKGPDGMETIVVPEGLYAVFIYKGPASAAGPTYQHIYGTWLPNSEYSLDGRPHLAIMGGKYKGEDPESEEELWIPIKA
jgi:AraC family transcriptional regulator